jgi:hypothetical protein
MTSPAMHQARLTARRHAQRITRDHIERHMPHGYARPARPFRLRLWIPVSLLWILLPVIVIVSPVVLAWRANPGRVIAAFAGIVAGLSGTLVEVDTPDAHIHLRLF